MIDNIDNLSHVLASALRNETEMVPNNPNKTTSLITMFLLDKKINNLVSEVCHHLTEEVMCGLLIL